MSFLRRILFLDAATCFATGLLLTLGASLLAGWLGLPDMLLRYAGISLLPFAAFLLYLAAKPLPPRGGVWLVIALNGLWVLDSVLLLIAGGVAPTTLGYAFVLAQAAAVLVLAELEWLGLRRQQADGIISA